MTKNEAREWLRNNTGMELPDDDEITAQQDMQQTIAQNAQQIKRENFVNKFNDNVKIRKCKMCKEHQHAFCTKRGCQCQ